jgi:DNA-directed RNA polymerase subunit RPC12/RpoP
MKRLYDLIEREQTPGGKCPHCGTTQGFITIVGTQSVLRCNGCERHLYNPPKTETGDKPRTLSTTHAAIKPKQRMRIIERANGRCETCGSRNLVQVGHVVSVEDGHKLALPDAVINSDENLICQCAECNSGQSGGTMPLRMYCAILKARVQHVG